VRPQRIIAFLIIAAIGYFGLDQSGIVNPQSAPAENSGNQIAQAFSKRLSDVQVAGSGEVIRVLADDLNGSRHQRFLLKIPAGLTLLIAHNIDLAPRIDALREGDQVEFNGEYEWNDKGGVVHWTHHDPQGRHTPGWLKHNGRKYD